MGNGRGERAALILDHRERAQRRNARTQIKLAGAMLQGAFQEALGQILVADGVIGETEPKEAARAGTVGVRTAGEVERLHLQLEGTVKLTGSVMGQPRIVEYEQIEIRPRGGLHQGQGSV